MSSNANLESITNELEKENPLTAEALGSTLLSKDAIELKTEIPFADEVWNTALMKSMGDMIELDFLELRDIITVEQVGKYIGGNVVPDFKIFVNVEVENKDGIKLLVKMPLAKYLAELYKRQIGYSEEYAVSHNRKGRQEVADMVAMKEKAKQGTRQPDMLGDITKR